MANPQIRFYRGSQNASLPVTITDGAFYVLDAGDGLGEIWVDIEQNKRVKIGSNNIISKTEAEWRTIAATTTSHRGTFYIYTNCAINNNYSSINEGQSITRVKIGDGNAKVSDLPFISVLPQQVDFWNNKLNCIDTVSQNTEDADFETLIFNRL